jgi:ABC-type sugar transport system permease subunit
LTAGTLVRRRSRRELREWLLFVAFLTPNLLLLSLFTFWPLVYNVFLSFHEWDFIAPEKLFVGLENYRDTLGDPVFRLVLRNTFVFVGSSVGASIVLGLLLALLLNQPLRGRDGARATLFAPTLLSGAAVAIVWIFMFDPNYGLIRSFLAPFRIPSPNWLKDPNWAMVAVIVVDVWKNLGFSVVIYIAGLQAIPAELYEAARVDGAGAWHRFWNVTLPQLSPVTFFLLVTGILGSFQSFDIIKVMTNGGPVNFTKTLIYYLYEEGFVAFHAGVAAVIAVVLFALMLVVTALQFWYVERRVHYA